MGIDLSEQVQILGITEYEMLRLSKKSKKSNPASKQLSLGVRRGSFAFNSREATSIHTDDQGCI